jgi:hypothetical protein
MSDIVSRMSDIDGKDKEFEEFAAGNSAYARRIIFPNERASSFCS